MTWRMLLRPAGLVRAYVLFFTGRLTFEQVLRAAARPVGKLIAIGEPGERMPTLGLKNVYVDDDSWQVRETGYVETAELVVIRAGTSEGVMWEVERVAQARSSRNIADLCRPADEEGERKGAERPGPSSMKSSAKERQRRSQGAFPHRSASEGSSASRPIGPRLST